MDKRTLIISIESLGRAPDIYGIEVEHELVVEVRHNQHVYVREQHLTHTTVEINLGRGGTYQSTTLEAAPRYSAKRLAQLAGALKAAPTLTLEALKAAVRGTWAAKQAQRKQQREEHEAREARNAARSNA